MELMIEDKGERAQEKLALTVMRKQAFSRNLSYTDVPMAFG